MISKATHPTAPTRARRLHFKTSSSLQTKAAASRSNLMLKPPPSASRHASYAALFVTILLIYLEQPAICLQSHHHRSSKLVASSTSASPCHQSWYNIGQKCFKIIHSPRNLEASRNRCRELSAEMVVLEDELQKSKEEEEEAVGGYAQAPSQTQAHNQSMTHLHEIATLTSHITSEMQNRLIYVNIGPNLMRQYKHEASTRRNGGELSDSIDTDFVQSELWIPRDEANFSSYRFDPDTSADSLPGFVLAKFRDRWGLLPISPTRKVSFLCEMPATRSPDRHHSRNHPKVSSEHQSVEPRRSSEITGQGLSGGNGIPASSLSASVVPNDRANPDDSRQSEREHTPTTSQAPPPVLRQQEVTTSALFRDIPQNQSIVMGSSAEMRCSPIDHDSSLHWTVDGRNLTQSNRIRLHPNGTLRIEHVRNNDGGNYTCTITSGGTVESRWARVEILERPHPPEYIEAKLLDKISTSVRIEWTPGFNGNSPITKYLIEMRTVIGDNIDGYDLNAVSQARQWETAKANISADSTNVIIQDLKPARRYVFRVKAANRIGISDPSVPSRPPIEVPVQPPSMAPEGLSGTPRSSTSISVQWLPPPADSQNGPIKAYKIRHKLAGYASDTDWYTSDVAETTHLNFILDDLITWQNYEIQIAAENDKGVGPFSSSIFIRTKEGKPDRGPRSVVADAVSSSKIKITWNPPPPQHINGVNLGYRIEIWNDSSPRHMVKELTVAHNSLTPLQAATVDGLLPYTDYYITIKCFTSAGDGVPNEETIVVKTKQDLPEAVPTLEFMDVLDKSLRVVWRPPNRSNGELNQYTLEYWETLHEGRKSTKILGPSVNEARIVDLTPQTLYTFRICPHTDVGQGPGRSNQTKTSVPPVLPEPPSNLAPVNIGPYSATIQFEPGFDGNAAIEKWIAEAQVATNGDYKPRWQTIYISTNHTTNGNSLVVRNLRPYTRYKIRLIPTNIVGQSRYPSEATAEFQTSQIEPEQAPKDFTIEEVKTNSAVARWSPLGNTNWSGHPRGYNLTWSEAGNLSISFQMINDTRADSFLIKDLEEFTEYTFKLHAVNDAGQSTPSEPVVVTTLEDVPSSGPVNVTARALTSNTISVDWNNVPKRHRNGIIRGFKIQYQASKPNAPLQYKSAEENNTKHVILNDLKPFTLYHLAVAAYTSVGDGVYGPIISAQTLEDTPGVPQNVSSPPVSQNTARILWDPPEDANGDILGYKVSYYALNADGRNANMNSTNVNSNNREIISHELKPNERTFKASNLKPDTHYVFTVTAKTKEGWGRQASIYVPTFDSESRANFPFYREGWFVILCACLSVVITIIVTALLFIQTKSYKYKQDAIKSTTSQDRLGEAGFTIEDDPGSHYNNGFGLLSNSAHHRRSNGAISQSTANFTLPKTPPRPHPGSAVYSDDDGANDGAEGDDDVFEDNLVKSTVRSVAGTSHYDSSGDSVTEKPSEISSSPAPESESADEDEYVNMANRHFVNHYANVNGTLRSQRSWRRNNGQAAAKHYSSSNHRTKPKLPQRPAPSVPQVPVDHSQSSSDTASTRPIAGPSGIQHSHQHANGRLQNGTSNGTSGGFTSSSSTYGDSQTGAKSHQQQLETDGRAINHNQQVNGTSLDSMSSETYPKMDQIQRDTRYQSQQTTDLLNNNHLVSLNGGRIIVDNMAGSRAPLPGFTSFV